MISKRKDNDTYEENLDVPKDTNIGLNKQKGFLCSGKASPNITKIPEFLKSMHSFYSVPRKIPIQLL